VLHHPENDELVVSADPALRQSANLSFLIKLMLPVQSLARK
jgi:hypothetical protein